MVRRRGCLITLEGPEGSGKSTHSRWLASRLRRAGYRVTLVNDPGSTRLGQSLRRLLLHTQVSLSPLAEALLFIGGRVELVQQRIVPVLTQGHVVICDRFHDATVAYQGFGGGVDVRWLDRLGRQAIGGVMPSLTVLLDVPTKIGFGRLRRAHDRMEQKAATFHRRVRRGYLTLARQQPRRFVIVDASQPMGHVRRNMESAVLSAIKRSNSQGCSAT